MDFWPTTIQYFWHEESLFVLFLGLCLAFFLFSFLKEERKSVMNTLAFFFACLTLQFVSGLIHAMQFTYAALVFHEAAVIGAGIAVIR